MTEISQFYSAELFDCCLNKSMDQRMKFVFFSS